MKFKKIMLLAIFLVSLLAVSAVSANDFNTTDEVIGEKIAIDDTNQIELASDEANEVLGMEPIPELQNLIDNSKNGDVIELKNDYSVNRGYIDVNKSITIDGNNHKIDANNQPIFLNVLSDSVTLKNIQFVNWGNYNDKSTAGYMEISASDVTISNCKFINSTSGRKSIVYSTGPNFTLDSCQFIECNSLTDGSVYSKGSNLKITNTDFINNNNYYGIREYEEDGYDYNPFDSISDAGALYIAGDNAFVSNCNFMQNTGYMSGAIIVVGNKGYVKDCSFSNNNVRHIKDFDHQRDYNTFDDAGRLVIKHKLIWYNLTAGAIKWEGDNGIFDSIVTENNGGFGDVIITGKNVTRIESSKLEASDVTKYYGGSEKYTVTLTNNGVAIADANVKISIDGKTQTVKTNSKGQASVDLNLAVGNHDVIAEYKNAIQTSRITVKSTITASDVTGIYSNSKVTATFLNTAGKALASKQVTFKIGISSYSATTDSNGVASANIPLGVGTYTVTAVNPANNEQKTFKLIISKADSKIALTSTQSNGVTTLTALLTPATATGSVVFNVNGENMNAAISSGKATLTLNDLEAGNYMVTASYNGDKNLKASASNAVTFNVAEVYPILTADPVTKTYGASTKLVVNLVDSKGNAIANADVSVVMGSATTHIKTDSSGKATMSINKAPGTYTATITYLDAKTTAKITVKKATPKLTAKAKTFKKSVKTKKYSITLKTNQNKVMKNTKLTLKVNGKTYSATTNAKGQATFKITKLTKKGKFTAVVKFAGNKYYNAKTVKPKITVK